ncbi:unnamed protein product [Heterosigma akashiwo]
MNGRRGRAGFRGGGRGGRDGGGRGRGGGGGGRGRGGSERDAQAKTICQRLVFSYVVSDQHASRVLPDQIDVSDLMAGALCLGDEFIITPVRRPAYCSVGTEVQIMTNHYKLEYNPQGLIVQYDLDFGPGMDRSKMPKKKCWAIFKDLMDQHFGGALGSVQCAYDGRANIYAASELPGGRVLQLTVRTQGRRGEVEVPLTLKGVGRRSLKDIVSFLGNPPSSNVPQDCFTALDIVLRTKPSLRMTSVGASFFTGENAFQMTGGIDLWSGWYQSLRATQSGLTLNVDTSATAFIRPQPLLEYAAHVLRRHGGVDELVHRGIGPREHRTLKSELNWLMVSVNHRENAKGRSFKIAGVGRLPANQQMFPQEDGTEMSVADYFAQRYRPLRYPQLPCLQIGSRSKNNWLPMECCHVIEGQKLNKLQDIHTSDIIRQTCKRPYSRNAAIHDQFKKTRGLSLGYTDNFGIRFTEKAVKVTGHVLQAPTLKYAGNSEQPQGGAWNLRNKKFTTGASLRVWSVVCLVGRNEFGDHQLRQYVMAQVEMFKNSGMTVQNERPPLIYHEDKVRERESSTIAKTMEIANDDARKQFRDEPAPEFILVIKDRKETFEYQQIKVCSDTQLGVACQCVTLRIAGQCNASCLANIALQVNAKLGGKNSTIDRPGLPCLDAPTIIFGADVNHPGAMNTSKPSVAAVTASMDRDMSAFAGTCRVQSHRQEIIQDLEAMVTELFGQFHTRNGINPQRIIFYRDGVGENQYAAVAAREITAIKRACEKLEPGWNPPITFVIVQKRHHTRLFAHNEQDQDHSGNIQPGLVVDTGVCHPHGYDFFLCSHGGLQGTSKPTYYYVLTDENGYDPNKFITLTYQLCYMYTACTRSVSAVPPAFYAHLMAFRGAFYIHDMNTETTSTSNGSSGGDERHEVNWSAHFNAPHPNVTQRMYFV